MGIAYQLSSCNIFVKSFLVNVKRIDSTQVYFLIGYSEELLAKLLKQVVKINVQSIINRQDLIFKMW